MGTVGLSGGLRSTSDGGATSGDFLEYSGVFILVPHVGCLLFKLFSKTENVGYAGISGHRTLGRLISGDIRYGMTKVA